METNSPQTKSSKLQTKGFTLLELLIVITIISVLSVILIVALNPAETLRKARDTQRLSDLASAKTALGIYITSESAPILDGGTNTLCRGGSGTDTIWYSYPSSTAITDTSLDGASGVVDAQVASANLGEIDGDGWIPVNLSGLTGGSPISNFPIDPTNTITAPADVDYDDLVYRYSCDPTDLTFEINAKLESQAFTIDDDKADRDGGDNTDLYEVGTELNILGYSATDANEF